MEKQNLNLDIQYDQIHKKRDLGRKVKDTYPRCFWGWD